MITALVLTKQRSMQCDLMWRSLIQNCPNLFDDVIFQIAQDGEEYTKGYLYFLNQWKTANIGVVWEEKFAEDFQNTLFNLKEYTDTKYILGITDDTIFYRDNLCQLPLCIEDVFDNQTLFLSLRLGLNTTIQNPDNDAPMEPIPWDWQHVTLRGDNFIGWNWKKCKKDHNTGYPFSFDGCVYRLDDLIELCKSVKFRTLRDLEGEAIYWFREQCNKDYALAFNKSCCTNVDFNCVSTTGISRSPYFITPETLNSMYLRGYRMNLNKMLSGVTIKASHVYLRPEFLKGELDG